MCQRKEESKMRKRIIAAALAAARRYNFQTRICVSTLYSYIDKRVFLTLTNKHLWDKRRKKQKKDDGTVVIDLHADEVLETTAGMNTADILHYQIDVFKKTMDENKKKKGQKIVFIHGKGEGVLRHALVHELNYRYKSCTYQDASFQEYGYGATQVTIK